jgi:mono/diheme cytochrome c family protein
MYHGRDAKRFSGKDDKPVKQSRLLVLPGLLVLMGVLATGCATPSVRAALQATETATPEEEAPTATLQATATSLPTPTRIPDANCVGCHGNAELLQELAEEEEVVEVPSEGSG